MEACVNFLEKQLRAPAVRGTGEIGIFILLWNFLLGHGADA